MWHKLQVKPAASWLVSQAALVGLLCLALMSCGGSRSSLQTEGRPGEEVDIDKLLGGDEQQASAQQNSEEDEVLRLLGLIPETKAEEPKKEEVVAEVPKTETMPAAKPEEVVQLERELQQKNQVISDLQSNLGEKDKRIQTLQSELEQAKRAGSASGTSMISGNYAQRYSQGRELYEQRKYADAIRVFSELLREDDKNKLADNAQYWIGECYYGMGNFSQSLVEFEKIALFARSEKHDDAQLKIALCYLQKGERAQAKSELEQLLAAYPTSEYVDKAKQYLSKL